jgi:hypothetical protein
VPALVRRRLAAAITLGAGLGGGLGCGGSQPSMPATDDGSADAVQSSDGAQELDVESFPLDSGGDAGGLADVVVDKHDVFEPPCGVK